jgi:hypothetical protein
MIEAWLLCLVVCGFMAYTLYRGHRHPQPLTRDALLIRSLFVSMTALFILRMPAIQAWGDSYFGNYPITYTLELMALLALTTAYALLIRRFVEGAPIVYPIRRGYWRLVWVALPVALTLLGLLLVYRAEQLSYVQTKYLMKWLVEVYALLQCVGVFVPMSWHLVHHEQVFVMRIKHLAGLVLTGTFALTAALAVIFIPPILLTGKENPMPTLIMRGPIATPCLVVLLVPHRWLAFLLLPQYWRRYRSLMALERRLPHRVSLYQELIPWWHWVRPELMEIGIYLKVIAILDHYRRVDLHDPVVCELSAQIQEQVSRHPEYEHLVEALCCVTI